MDAATSSTPDPITGVVQVLSSYPKRTQAEVALGTGMPKRTLIRRMQHGGWTVEEVRSLARFFDVDVRVLLDGPDALFQAAGVRSTKSGWWADSRQLTLDLDDEAMPPLAPATVLPVQRARSTRETFTLPATRTA